MRVESHTYTHTYIHTHTHTYTHIHTHTHTHTHTYTHIHTQVTVDPYLCNRRPTEWARQLTTYERFDAMPATAVPDNKEVICVMFVVVSGRAC